MEIVFLVILVSVFLILIISISWTNYKGSPWVPTTFKMVHKMLDLAEIKPGDLVYDLGCGDGRISLIAARKYQAKVVCYGCPKNSARIHLLKDYLKHFHF